MPGFRSPQSNSQSSPFGVSAGPPPTTFAAPALENHSELVPRKGDCTPFVFFPHAVIAAAGPVAALSAGGLAVLAALVTMIRLEPPLTTVSMAASLPLLCSTSPRPARRGKRLVLGSALSLPLAALAATVFFNRYRAAATRGIRQGGFTAGPPVRVLAGGVGRIPRTGEGWSAAAGHLRGKELLRLPAGGAVALRQVGGPCG